MERPALSIALEHGLGRFCHWIVDQSVGVETSSTSDNVGMEQRIFDAHRYRALVAWVCAEPELSAIHWHRVGCRQVADTGLRQAGDVGPVDGPSDQGS